MERDEDLSTVNGVASAASSSHRPSKSSKEATMPETATLYPSPVQLNLVEELPASSNVDCVSLGSILGDPMIKECWLFNYLFDMDFVM